jgi:hypothetical protein
MLLVQLPRFDVRPHLKHAPAWVFLMLAVVIGIMGLVLYFTNSTGGGEKDHLYGDPSRQFHLPRGGYGPFGGPYL